jgi:hypothetical protein
MPVFLRLNKKLPSVIPAGHFPSGIVENNKNKIIDLL